MFDREAASKILMAGLPKGRIGMVFSCWDLLHAGHCLMLEFARQNCDFLVAGLQVDPTKDRPWKNKPIMSIEERRILIRSNRNVDAVIEYDDEQDHYDILAFMEPSVRFFGSDYLKQETYTGIDLKIPVMYHERESHGWSTSSLRTRIIEAFREG